MQISELRHHREYIQPLAIWHQQEWSHLNPGESLEQRIKRMQEYLTADFIPSMFVAHDDNSLFGSAAIVKNDMDIHQNLTPWLASVFVKKENRKQRIGRQLVLHVLQQAKTRGIKKIYLYTEDQMDFYQKLGWKPYCKERYKNQPVDIMVFDLKLNDSI